MQCLSWEQFKQRFEQFLVISLPLCKKFRNLGHGALEIEFNLQQLRRKEFFIFTLSDKGLKIPCSKILIQAIQLFSKSLKV